MRPRLGAVQPVGYTCVREVGATFGERLCGQPASWHVMWDETRANSIACEAHMDEAHERWQPADWHPLSAACTSPGGEWVTCHPPGTGFCIEGETHPDLAALEQPRPSPAEPHARIADTAEQEEA